MKTLIALLMIFSASAANANPILSCGFPPFPPLGCNVKPVCVCDGNGNCGYVFIGC